MMRILPVSALLLLVLLPAPLDSTPDRCRTLAWRMVTLLEEASATMVALTRVVLEAEGIPPEQSERMLARLLEPGPLLSAPARGGADAAGPARRHFAAFERARLDVMRAAGCNE